MKNKIIIFLFLLVILLISYILYNKFYQNSNLDNNLNDDKINVIKDDTNQIIDNNIVEYYTEEDIVSYFEDLEVDLINYDTNDETIGNKIKDKFIKCIDFLFYDDEIGGKTFNELTNASKLKILEITMSIDKLIESKFPSYKENIGSIYQNIKSKVVGTYLDTTTKICNDDLELCNSAKEGFKKLKSNFGLTWDMIKELLDSGKTKLKDWYEIWKYN